jgi:hypothetical protein
MAMEISTVRPARLKRWLGLPLLVLYGTGITIGAGFYVLIGAVAGHAGVYAPWSFPACGRGDGVYRCFLHRAIHALSGQCG